VAAAFVVPVAHTPFDPRAFSSWARERVANYKVPSQVFVVPDLPRNASGKVLKRELRVPKED
jgi:acyl-CoA synthetase (AMP-forming)/AMP-acid ligase II